MTRYNFKNIRNLLNEGFSDQQLRRLCYDVSGFRPVYDELARNSGKGEIIDLLIEHADRTLQVETLLALAKERNPTRYKKHQPYKEQHSVVSVSKPNNNLLIIFLISLSIVVFLLSICGASFLYWYTNLINQPVATSTTLAAFPNPTPTIQTSSESLPTNTPVAPTKIPTPIIETGATITDQPALIQTPVTSANTPDTISTSANLLTFGIPITASMSKPGDKIYYEFEGRANDLILIRVTRISDDLFCPAIKLLDPNHNEVVQEHSGIGCTHVTLEASLSLEGSYLIRINDGSLLGNLIGDYSLHLQKVSPDNATSLAFGKEITDTIDLAGVTKLYTFEGHANDLIVIRVTKISGDLFCPAIRLLDQDLNEIKQESSQRNECINVTIERSLLLDSNYIILINDGSFFKSYTGDYNLHLEKLP